MADEFLRASFEAEAILRASGWSPDRKIDVSAWVERLRRDGNRVFPVAVSILESFGALRLNHAASGGSSRYDFEINPTYWYGERERVADIEAILASRLCPLGEESGGAMLAVLADGKVISEFEGEVHLIGENWALALDHLLLGRGSSIRLSEDYVLVDSEKDAEHE